MTNCLLWKDVSSIFKKKEERKQLNTSLLGSVSLADTFPQILPPLTLTSAFWCWPPDRWCGLFLAEKIKITVHYVLSPRSQIPTKYKFEIMPSCINISVCILFALYQGTLLILYHYKIEANSIFKGLFNAGIN